MLVRFFFLVLSFSLLSFVPPDGAKTKMMLETLNQAPLAGYREKEGTFQYLGTQYKILCGHVQDISQSPIASIGSGPQEREIITLDPKHAPFLEKKYREFLLEGSYTWQALSDFIRNCIFDKSLCQERYIRSLVDSRPVVSLEAFIESQVGVCRHFAFVAAYFLDRLSKEDKIPRGTGYYVRDLVQTERGELGHAWNLFVLEDGSAAWHIDSQWNVIKNLNKREDFNFLVDKYGKKAIWNERNRFLSYNCPKL